MQSGASTDGLAPLVTLSSQAISRRLTTSTSLVCPWSFVIDLSLDANGQNGIEVAFSASRSRSCP